MHRGKQYTRQTDLMYNEAWHPGILGIPLILLLTAYRILLFGEISMHCCYRRRFPTKPDSLTPCLGEATNSMWTDEQMWIFYFIIINFFFLGCTDANFRAVSSLRRNCFFWASWCTCYSCSPTWQNSWVVCGTKIQRHTRYDLQPSIILMKLLWKNPSLPFFLLSLSFFHSSTSQHQQASSHFHIHTSFAP